MKKIFLGIAAVSMLAFSSCNDDQAISTLSMPITTYSLVTTDGGSSAPVVLATTYSFNFDRAAGEVKISAELPVSTTGSLSFATNSLPYSGGQYVVGDRSGEIITVKSASAGTSTNQSSVTNFDCQLTTFFNIPPTVDGIQQPSYPYGYEYAVMSYNIGQYNVRTFWPDVTFSGRTTTQYPYQGVNKQFTTEEVAYRIIMNVTDKKATVVIYDALLAEEMPKAISNIVLEDLPVVFNAQGYSINAENVTPKVYEAGTATPNTRYVFDKFSLYTFGDLTSTNISYTVAGVYKGDFSGSYCVKLTNEN